MRSSNFRSQLNKNILNLSDSAKERHAAVVKTIFGSMEERLSFPLVLFLEGYILEDIAEILETSEQEIKENLKEGWNLLDFSTLSKTSRVAYPLLNVIRSWFRTPLNYHISKMN
ncbi:MAG: hypothetical protein DHS20C18_24280 [Saprospiraceae bacterium]|nr:MAG: hypothetical protein DHS20C18_24280 [Saprospiraceae bacterium]